MVTTYRSLLTEGPQGVLCFGGARMALMDIEGGLWALRRQMEALVGRRLTDTVLEQAGANAGVSFARSFVGDSGDAQALRDCIAAYQAAGFGRLEILNLDWSRGRALIQAQGTFEAWAQRQHGQTADRPVCVYTAGVLVGFVNALVGRHDVVCIERACQAQGAESCLFELLPVEEAGDQPMVAFAPDPALGRQLNLLEMLFERMPMGIAIFDRNYRIQRYSPTWADMAERYAPASAPRLEPGIYYFDHFPGAEEVSIPMFERVLAGETIRGDALRFESGGIVSYWDVVLAPLVEKGEVVGILNVTVDATARVAAQRNLEQQVEARTKELQTLLNITSAAGSSLELDELLHSALDKLVSLVGASRAGVMLVDEESGALIPKALRPEQVLTPDAQAQMSQACQGVIASGELLYVAPDLQHSLIEPGALLPLRAHGKPQGVLVIIGPVGTTFSDGQLALFESIADQLGGAIENARLYKHAEAAAVAAERNRLARDLHDAVTQTLFSSSLIAEVLPLIWERDPAEGRRRLAELRELTRGALAEMRTLLLELRPSALEEASLGDLLRQLAESVTGRARVPVALDVDGECELEPEVKSALYRIAQEALNNVAKHAGANEARVRLCCRPGKGELSIHDDGAGFDPGDVAPDSLGLGIMRERAEVMDAELSIDSHPGEGTQIRVAWRGNVP